MTIFEPKPSGGQYERAINKLINAIIDSQDCSAYIQRMYWRNQVAKRKAEVNHG